MHQTGLCFFCSIYFTPKKITSFPVFGCIKLGSILFFIFFCLLFSVVNLQFKSIVVLEKLCSFSGLDAVIGIEKCSIVFVLLLFVLQILDLAVSLAKVADVDRTLGKEDVAVDGFEEAIKLLESLTLKSEEVGLEPRVRFP